MDDALAVRRFERFRNLLRDGDGFIDGDGTFSDPLCERRSFDELEDESV